jgi:acetyl-CoA C-acetyltransferase
MTINKVCGSGLKAVALGDGATSGPKSSSPAAQSMSIAPIYFRARTGYRIGDGELVDL